MSVSGYFSDFSFPELLRFIHSSHKTGSLQIKAIDNASASQASYFFWFRGGDVVAVQHPRVSLHILLPQFCKQSSEALKVYFDNKVAHNEPVGTALKRLQLIQPEELHLIFNRQVVQPILHHFTLDNAWFKFVPNNDLPFEEMTGLNMSPIEAALSGLRRLRTWEPLRTKLPESTSSLSRASKSFAPYQLTNEEAQVWNLADEEHSLSDIAHKLILPLEDVQKISFRLMIAGLVDECPSVKTHQAVAPAVEERAEKSEVSSSFLSNLLGFLKQRA